MAGRGMKRRRVEGREGGGERDEVEEDEDEGWRWRRRAG
jgi:hypothetical protein